MSENTLKIRNQPTTLKKLRISLKYRPKIFALILKMRQCIRKKNSLISKLKNRFKEMNVNSSELETKSTNTENTANEIQTESIQGISTNVKVTKENEAINDKQTIATNSEEECQNSGCNDKISDETLIISETCIDSDISKNSMELETVIPDYKVDTPIKIIEKLTKDQATQTDKKKIKKEKDLKNCSGKSLNQVQSEVIELKDANPDEQQHSPKKVKDVAWDINENKEKSIAEQVKEAAQEAMKDSGMVYVESAGMYYDYKTGYYYNSELGLYYHTDTGCYYYYSDDKQFMFHSYPDRSALAANASLIAHERKKAKKHKMDKEDGETKPKKKKKKALKKKDEDTPTEKDGDTSTKKDGNTPTKKGGDTEKSVDEKCDLVSSKNKDSIDEKESGEKKISAETEDLEDGECSETDSDVSDDDDDKKSNASTSTASDDETVAKHHPPCMRIIVRETSLPKLRVGTLFIITKDGGTIGREGDHHTVVLRDNNVSRNHMDIKYDPYRRAYMAIDLGSKNGSVLNGSRMSPSQLSSEPMEIVHGSTLQLGETKLLCHIHPGNDTCGHCEPGLLMEAIEKDKKVAYTRTCNVKMQHELELARLKNKYAPKQLCIEETAYNDRAQARREAVGSSHHSEKTQTTDISTSIAADNKGFKLLQKMGWSKGEGLGKDSQGETEPVPLVSNDGTKCLGAPEVPTPRMASKTLGPATLRLAAKTKMLRPPAKAFQQSDQEDSE